MAESVQHADTAGWAAVLVVPSLKVLVSLFQTASRMTDRITLVVSEAVNAEESEVLRRFPHLRYVGQFLAFDGSRSALITLSCICEAHPAGGDADRSLLSRSRAFCSLAQDPSLLFEIPTHDQSPGASKVQRRLTIALHPAHVLAVLQILERSGVDHPDWDGDMSCRFCIARDVSCVVVDSPLLGERRMARLRVLHDVGEPLRFIPWVTSAAQVSLTLSTAGAFIRLLESSAVIDRHAECVIFHNTKIQLHCGEKKEFTASIDTPVSQQQQQQLRREEAHPNNEATEGAQPRVGRCNVVQTHAASALQVANALLRAMSRHACSCSIAAEIDDVKGTLGIHAWSSWCSLDIVLLGSI